MNSETFDTVVSKLTELRLKERYNKNDKKYVLTKEELLVFCLELIKVIKENEESYNPADNECGD